MFFMIAVTEWATDNPVATLAFLFAAMVAFGYLLARVLGS